MPKSAPTPDPAPAPPQPGPTDVTLEEALDEMTGLYAQAMQQVAVSRIRVRKLEALVKSLQAELAPPAPE